MDLFNEFLMRLGFFGYSLIGLLVFLVIKAIYNQLNDGEEYNGEFSWNKKDKDD